MVMVQVNQLAFLNATGGAQLGVTTASATAITLDEVLDLFYSLKAPYRNKAVFVMNDATIKAIRKLKDGQRTVPMATFYPSGNT